MRKVFVGFVVLWCCGSFLFSQNASSKKDSYCLIAEKALRQGLLDGTFYVPEEIGKISDDSYAFVLNNSTVEIYLDDDFYDDAIFLTSVHFIDVKDGVLAILPSAPSSNSFFNFYLYKDGVLSKTKGYGYKELSSLNFSKHFRNNLDYVYYNCCSDGILYFPVTLYDKKKNEYTEWVYFSVFDTEKERFVVVNGLSKNTNEYTTQEELYRAFAQAINEEDYRKLLKFFTPSYVLEQWQGTLNNNTEQFITEFFFYLVEEELSFYQNLKNLHDIEWAQYSELGGGILIHFTNGSEGKIIPPYESVTSPSGKEVLMLTGAVG